MRWIGTLLVAPAVVGGLLWWRQAGHEEATTTRLARFIVQSGDLRDVLRETGVLAPQDPTLVAAPFDGQVKWVLPDGSWVEKGDEIIVFGEEEILEDVSKLQTQILDKRQELRLAKLTAEHTRTSEQQKVDKEKRDYDLAAIQHRILTTPWEGGERLLELDEKLRPCEEKLEQLQEELAPIEKAFRDAQQTYLEALALWQEARGKLLEVQARADFAEVKREDARGRGGAGAGRGGKRPGGGRPQRNGGRKADPAGEPKADAGADLAQAIAAAQAEVASAKAALDTARSEQDAKRKPYQAAVAELRQVEETASELQVLVEIEKRGVPAVQLALDVEVAELRLKEAEREAENGKRAYEAGAISKSRYEQLEAAAKEARGRLEILKYRYEIAARPAPPDEVAASEATLAAAKRDLDNANAVFEREMALQEAEIGVVEAELAQLETNLRNLSKGFAEGIAGMMEVYRTELELLGADEGGRRAEIIRRLAELEKEKAAAEAAPPNVVRAPHAGLMRLREEDDRPTDVGDDWDEGDTVAMIYPAGNMSVQAGVNEVNFPRVASGQTCTVRLPALDLEIPDAKVTHVSQIGRDRNASDSAWTARMPMGIIEFALAVELGREIPEARQGMTVYLEIETARREGVSYLPAAAVALTGDGFGVYADENAASLRPVDGYYFGDDWFVVESGLAAGEAVYRIYPGGQP